MLLCLGLHDILLLDWETDWWLTGWGIYKYKACISPIRLFNSSSISSLYIGTYIYIYLLHPTNIPAAAHIRLRHSRFSSSPYETSTNTYFSIPSKQIRKSSKCAGQQKQNTTANPSSEKLFMLLVPSQVDHIIIIARTILILIHKESLLLVWDRVGRSVGVMLLRAPELAELMLLRGQELVRLVIGVRLIDGIEGGKRGVGWVGVKQANNCKMIWMDGCVTSVVG